MAERHQEKIDAGERSREPIRGGLPNHPEARAALEAAIAAGKLRTKELAEQDRRDYCADCAETFYDPVHGWMVRVTCGFGCEHAHHDTEVWQGATSL